MLKLRVLSLGAGVQSSTILLMSCKGILPKLDAAIFADPHWEPAHVYRHLWWLAEQAAIARIPVYIASKGSLKANVLEWMVKGVEDESWASMPFYVKTVSEQSQTSLGQVSDMSETSQRREIGRIRRLCTKEYKLDVVEKFVREEMMGIPTGKHVPEGVEIEQWIGISRDEMRRIRPADKRYVVNEYPLIGWPRQYLEEQWTRTDCQKWFRKHYPGRSLLRSSCIGCPMHSNAEWVEMKKKRPEEWAEAVEFDKAVRKLNGMESETFVHPSCVPLGAANLEKADGRRTRWQLRACTGMCDT